MLGSAMGKYWCVSKSNGQTAILITSHEKILHLSNQLEDGHDAYRRLSNENHMLLTKNKNLIISLYFTVLSMYVWRWEFRCDNYTLPD